MSGSTAIASAAIKLAPAAICTFVCRKPMPTNMTTTGITPLK